MAENGAGGADCSDSTTGEAPPALPIEEPGQPFSNVLPPVDTCPTTTDQEHREQELHEEIRVPAAARVARRRQATERDILCIDDELQALGLWEEGMTEDQKVRLLKVIADSKETARREEAVRKSHFGWQTSSTNVVRGVLEESRVGSVKPCIATPEPPFFTDRLGHTQRMNIPVGKEDCEWPAPCEVPPRRKFATAKSRKPRQSTRRLSSIDQPLNFQWEDEDSSDDLYDIRSPEKDPAQSIVDKRSDLGDSEDLPCGQTLPGDSPTGMLPEATTGAVSQDERLPGATTGLMHSWATMHGALRAAQSVQGLPVRPWGQPRDPSSVGGEEDSKIEDPDKALKEAPEGDPGSSRTMEDSEAQG